LVEDALKTKTANLIEMFLLNGFYIGFHVVFQVAGGKVDP
jgi:hypothetical protein